MNRVLCFLAIALVASLGLAASAEARAALFRVEIKASQTTTWTQPKYQTSGGDCYNRPYRQAEGKEVVKFRGTGRAFAQGVGSNTFFTYGSPDFGPSGKRGIKLKATVDRQNTTTLGSDPGPCGGGRPAEIDEMQCGTRMGDAWGQLSWPNGPRRLQLRAQPVNPAELLFNDCTVHVPEQVNAGGLTEITQNAPARELLDPDFKKHIVIARKTFSGTLFPNFGPVNTTTNVFWHVTLTRLR